MVKLKITDFPLPPLKKVIRILTFKAVIASFSSAVALSEIVFMQQKYVSYGAYGEGNPPTFCASLDVSDAENWIPTETKHVWKCTRPMDGDVGNLIIFLWRIPKATEK